MAEATTGNDQGGDATRPPEEIEREIEQTREDLAETVAAVADKADVKKQAKRKVAGAKQRAKAKAADVKESLPGGAEKEPAPQGPAPASAGSAEPPVPQRYAEQARAYADENPERAAAIGALLAGIAIGWLLGRR